MSEPWEDFQDTKPWEDFGGIQSLNQTEGADPSRVWQGSLGKTLVEQGRRGMGWMQTPLINLPRFGPEYTQNPNAKPWQLFTEGAINRVASDVEGMSTFPNIVLAPLTLGQGIIARFLRPALVSLFGTKILGEQLPQAAGDASVKLIPSSSPVLPGTPESFSPSEKGESAAGVADLSVLGALLAHSAKPIDSLRVPSEPRLLGSGINPNLTLRDINEIQGQIPPERQLTQFNPTMATRGPDVLGARPGQVPIPLPERSGDIIPLLRDPRRQLMAPGEGEQLQQQQIQDVVARMIQERQYSMEGRDVRPSPIRLPEAAGEPSPTTLQLKGPPTFISGGEPSSTVSQKTLSPGELTEFQREALSNRLLEQRQPKGLQLKPTKEQASQKTQEGSINLSGPEEVLKEFKTKLMNGTQIINRLRNRLHPDEWEMYKDAGIEAFANKQVDPKEVAKWMEDNGPKVEVRKFGERSRSPEIQEYNNLTHSWFDSLQPSQKQDYYLFNSVHENNLSKLGNWRQSDIEKAIRYKELSLSDAVIKGDKGDTSHWSSIAPKAESKMPGYTEGAVVLPTRYDFLSFEQLKKETMNDLRSGKHGSYTTEELEKIESAKNKEDLKFWLSDIDRAQFPSSHYFPPNTLAFWRGYMETTKEGKKVFHVIEVQSDWAQKARGDKEILAQKQKDLEKWTERQAEYHGISSDEFRKRYPDTQFLDKEPSSAHPLLRHYERLALKSAIEHAKAEGADAVAVSDAETAMMTEGHDRAHSVIGVSSEFPEPDQAPGMRLHYDQTLPKIAEELTGKKGERVEFGEHQMAFDLGSGRQGSDVFKEPTGEPKTSISARLYPLERVGKDFSTFGKDKLQTPDVIAKDAGLTFVGEQKPQVPGMQGLWEFRLKEPGKEMFSVTTKAGATAEEVKTAKRRKLEEVKIAESQKPRLQGLQLKPTAEQLKQRGQEGSINTEAIKETFKSWLGDKSGLDRPDRPSPAQKALKSERAKVILSSPTAKPLETRPEYHAQPGEKTTLGQKIVNKIRSAQNVASKGDKLLLPIDVILDDLDGGKADYKGPLFQQVRWPLDDDFNNELQRRDLYTKPIVDIVKENKLKKENGERIGVYAETLQEGGRQRLIDSGVKPSVIDNIVKTITPAELKVYSEMRKQLDASLPEVQKLAKELYETDVQPVKNYFPRLRNWEIFEPEASEIAGPKVGEKATQDLVSWRELSQDYTRKGTKTEQGYTIERQPNAKTGIKVNAFEVYDRHMKDVAHFLAMQKNLKEIGEIVRSEDFKKKYGDQGQVLLTDWLNVVAKQGRYKRNAILDTIRKNVAKGVIAFRIPSQLVHLANVPLAQERAGPIWHARGMEASLTDEGQAFLHKHFAETFERGGGEPGLQEAERGPITKAGFWLQRELDRLNAQATVLGVYMKRIEGKGKNPQEYHSLPVDMNAVREARVLARRAVASPIYKDVPLALTKGGSGAKFFFQFQNTFLDQWSNIRYDLVQAGLGKNFLNNPKLAARMSLAIAMMLLVETGIKYGAKQALNKATGYEPKDKESFKGKLLHEALKRVPGMGQAMAIAQYDETGIPGADVVKQVVKGTKQAIAADDTKGRILAGGKTATAVAELAGVPGASQVSEIAQSYAKGKFFETHGKRLEEVAGKPLEQMILQERRDAEKKLKEQRGSRSREDEAKGAATAIKQNAKRGAELQDGLKEEVKTWLNGKGLKVPNYDDTVSYGKQRLVLTTEEQARFKELLTEEYDKFLTPWVGKNVKQEQVSQRLEQATARARHRLLREMKR